MSLISRSLAASLVALAPLAAQSFSYPDFSSVASLTLLGNAAQSGAALRLTANASNQTGWAWHQTALPVVGGFDTTFTFRITPPTVGTKAEGMALVLHDDPNGLATQGGTVWGMGYGNGANGAVGIRNSIAIEFDTYQDGFLSDSSANEVTIHTRGALGNHEHEQYSIARATPGQNLANGQVHSLRVRYVPGTIEVFVDGAATPLISRAYDLTTGGLYANGQPAPAPTLANGTAWLGFCATTGAGSLTELVEILSWDWASTPPVHPCYLGTMPDDVLTVDGSAGDVFRRVPLATHQPFTVAIAPPAAVGPGGPFVLVMSLLPQPGAPGTNLGFGETCMPVLPTGPLELVLADGFGLFPALVPAGPLPYALPVPAGVLTFPLDFTLQAVTIADVAPFALGISNAIDVRIQAAPAPAITSVTPPSAAPGATVTVNGSGFVPGATLTVNGVPTAPIAGSATQVTFAYPAGLPCDATVVVQNPDGQSASAPINATPVVTQVLLGSGSAAGNQTFLVVGTGFAPGTTVTVGGAPALVRSVMFCVWTLRPLLGTLGPAPVVITTPGGCQATTSYTYL